MEAQATEPAVMTAKPEGSSEEKRNSSDDLLDQVEKALDIDREDEEMKERLKNPFVKKIVTALIVLLFLIFFTYFLSFIFEKPLPEAKLVEKFIDSIIEMMKIFLGG
uniref:Transmembrane protein n=1 Tax=Burkholderia phage vB_BgluM-SURPRISE13 TaxID=3159457 RepID=A0AAU7PG50_9VIRU